MGWYAETAWDISFSEADAAALANELLENFDSKSEGNSPVDDIASCLSLISEEAEFEASAEQGMVTLTGWTAGKSRDYGPDEMIVPLSGMGTYNAGGNGSYSTLAKYCVGKVDWLAEGEERWRVRFKDGGWTNYTGVVTFVGDDEE